MIENRSNKDDSQNTLAIILVSTDGHAHFLPACFQSIVEAATHVSVRVILVDNDGYGKSSVIVRDFMEVLDLEIIHQKKPKGFAGNVNDALKQVREPYVLLLNTDTILSKASLSKSLKRMQEISQIGGTFGAYERSGRATAGFRTDLSNAISSLLGAGWTEPNVPGFPTFRQNPPLVCT